MNFRYFAIGVLMLLIGSGVIVATLPKGPPPISITLVVTDNEGAPIENGTLYVWALRPRNASVLIGSFQIRDGKVNADLTNTLGDIVKEWKNYLKGKGLPGLMRTSLWFSIAYPGGIYSGITALYDPASVDIYGMKVSREIKLPVKVDNQKSIPKLLYKEETSAGKTPQSLKGNPIVSEVQQEEYPQHNYYVNESWLPVFVVLSYGTVYTKTEYFIGSSEILNEYYSRGAWIEIPEVKSLEELRIIDRSSVIYHIGDVNIAYSNAVNFGSLITLTRSEDIECKAVLARVLWVYEEHIYKVVDVYYGTESYIVEARAYIDEFIREIDENTGKLKDDLMTKIDYHFDYTQLKPYGEVKIYNTFTGNGLVDPSEDPMWSETLKALGDQGLLPKITEDNLMKDSIEGVLTAEEESIFLPIGSVIETALLASDMSFLVPLNVISYTVNTLSWSVDSAKIKFHSYSDAPKGLDYTVKYMISKYPYKYYTSEGEIDVRLPLTYYLVYSGSDYIPPSTGGSGGPNPGPGGDYIT